MFVQKRNLRWIVWFSVLAALLSSSPAFAREYFVVEDASSRLHNGVYLLEMDASLSLSDELRSALINGVPLTINIQVMVEKHRQWWLNEELAQINQRYVLSYHALSRQYLVWQANTRLFDYYSTAGAALDDVGQLSDFPLIDDSLLEPGQSYDYRVQVSVDSSELPLPLRARALFSQDWAPVSEVATWPLR